MIMVVDGDGKLAGIGPTSFKVQGHQGFVGRGSDDRAVFGQWLWCTVSGTGNPEVKETRLEAYVFNLQEGARTVTRLVQAGAGVWP